MSATHESDADDLLDEFLADRGHATEGPGWVEDYNKKRCPECQSLHDPTAVRCGVCGWRP